MVLCPMPLPVELDQMAIDRGHSTFENGVFVHIFAFTVNSDAGVAAGLLGRFCRKRHVNLAGDMFHL